MSFVETSVAHGVMTITLADVEHRNALSEGLMRELLAAIDGAEDDPDVRVVVVTNRGSVFCAGADLRAQTTGSDHRPPPLPELFTRIRRSPKPFVGRIAGHCVAGGLGLAAVMDISISLDTALFGFSEVRVGVAPAMIAVVCLPKMRDADARATFLRGHRFDGAEAARVGLVTTACAEDRLDAEVRAVVNDLLAGAPHALAATKQLLTKVPAMETDEAFAWTQQLSAALFASEQAREGMTAFLEKRAAAWVTSLPDEG